MARNCGVLALAAFALGLAAPAAAETLPTLTLDRDATTVSGLSSGAYMAVQLHVAFSSAVAGAGVVAGGPFYCARGSVFTALNNCMATSGDGPDPAPLLDEARAFAAAGRIDPLDGLAGDRVYLFSGTEDETVEEPVLDSARDFYRAAGVAADDIRYDREVPAGHAFLGESAPNACATTETPFLNDCGVDQAGDILTWLYGDLAPPAEPDPARLREFDQGTFLANPADHGMDPRGFVYIPEACEAGAVCRLHVAFHGCEQTPDQIGDLYARTAGYNRWAEANGIVVLYPQARIIPSPLFNPFGGNPKGCWDWWGYDDPAYFSKQGRQMAAVAAMAAQLGAPLDTGGGDEICMRYEASNWTHWLEDRAAFCGFFSLCARGSDEVLGPAFFATTLYEQPPGTFSTTDCR